VSTATHSYTVPGISCDHCKHAIETKVAPVAGVELVTVDIEAKSITVIGGDAGDVEAAIVDAGYSIA
jgi:copper chaperone CopZ